MLGWPPRFRSLALLINELINRRDGWLWAQDASQQANTTHQLSLKEREEVLLSFIHQRISKGGAVKSTKC